MARDRTIVEGDMAAVGATTDRQDVLGTAQFPATVTRAVFIPNAAITGNDTNKFTLTIVNEGQAGTGTTVVATLDFVANVNGVAGDEKEFTLSATAANLEIAEGDVLSVNSDATGGSGLANPGGVLRVEGEYAEA